MKHILKLTWQISLLWLIAQTGNWVQKYTHIPIPGNVLAMLLLLLLLLKGWIKLEWVRDGSDFLLKYLALFFIPIAVGLMDFGQLFLHDGLQILFIVLVSTTIGLATGGFTSQALTRTDRKKGVS